MRGKTKIYGANRMIGQESAEAMALQALGWLAGQDELFPQFLGATGADVADLPLAATRPEFLAAVVDFILMDDAMVIGFCDAVGLRYEMPMQMRALLPGGSGPHWT